jgi:hypothetical protein
MYRPLLTSGLLQNMELLIPGLILVALMIYASTRIKRTAAAAFEAEVIETDDFVIQKPEGMLHVINGDKRFAFEAYSKDFGVENNKDVRCVTATVEITNGTGVENVADVTEIIDDIRYVTIEANEQESGANLRVTRKLAKRDDHVFTLETKLLADAPEEYLHRVETLLNGFRLK